MHKTNPDSVTAVVLAGGEGRRMGGEDKGLMPLAGRPLAGRAAAALAAQAGSASLNCNRNHEAYAALGYPTFADDPAHAGTGPLAGMLTALERAEGDWVLFAPCDVPFLPSDLLTRLRGAVGDAPACCAHDGEALHPTVALVRRETADALRGYLAGGGRRVRDWLAGLGAAQADFSDRPWALTNVNRPEELARAEALFLRGALVEAGRELAPGPLPLLGFVAYSGTGKTTLLEKLLPLLSARGLRVGLLKHAHHDFDIDVPGKDSWRLRKAGAVQTLVGSRRRWALITETPDGREEPSLRELLAQLDPARLDLVIVEGFKHETFAKVELRREGVDRPPLWPADPNVVALASDTPAEPGALPQLDINDAERIAEYVTGLLVLPDNP